MEAAILMVDYLFLLQTSAPILTPVKRDWFTILTPVIIALGFVLQQLRSYLSAKTATERETLASMERDRAATLALQAKNAAIASAAETQQQIQDAKNAAIESASKQEGQIAEVHTLVNGRMSEALSKIAALENRWAKQFPKDETAQANAKVSADASKFDIGKQTQARGEK
jgi:hypothetical protein